MFKLGEIQELVIGKIVDFGVYLQEKQPGEERERVLLPRKQVPEGASVGDSLTVFLYKDSSDRLIATTTIPLLTFEKPSVLRVAQVNKTGAFLDWGLEKDLFLPYKQQTSKVREGDEVLVSLYIDKSERLCATMKVYKQLRDDSPYKVGDDVSGIVYDFSDNYGTFVAVDDIFSAIIPKNEEYGNLKMGNRITARVTKVRDDGKLNLSVRDKSYIQMYSDMDKLLDLIDRYSGVLPFTEKASPEVIKRETGMSKNEFKRAVGHLYKERKIDISDGKIRKV